MAGGAGRITIGFKKNGTLLKTPMYIIMTTDDRWPPIEVDEDLAEDDDDQEVGGQLQAAILDAVMAGNIERAYRGLMHRRGQEARML